ncbi:RhoGAP domain containing protein [Entamoeba marina]
MSTTHHSHKNSDDSLVTTSECKESSALSLTNTLTSDDSPNVTTPKLLTPRDVQKRIHHLLLEQDVFWTLTLNQQLHFLKKSKRATQFIYSGSQAMKHVLRKSLLVKINQQYGLAGNVKRNLSKSTNNNFPVNQVTTKVIEETQEIYKEKIFQMNIYFSELSSKKLLGMYDLFVGSLTTEPLTDTVDYAYNDSKLKQKKCTLHSNFLIISSIKEPTQRIVSKIDPFGITLNSSHTLIFENEERQKQWLEAIDKLSIWVESIPRTIMDQETPNGKITQPNITNAPRRVRTPTPPLTTPKKKH